jgi:tRNA pseudouridine55 synthase
MAKARGERLDGVLLLDKPVGMTSNRALQTVRRLLDAQKAGHTGTLDPLASGLLPTLLGEATKFSADLLEADKRYVATVRLGVTTSTGDAEGEVVERRQVDATAAEVDAVLARFSGAIEQVPPMHSALKRGGRPLYQLARAGVQVERTARAVAIRRLALVGRTTDTLMLDVECSKGTYVRVLAEDIGAALGYGAHLGALRRTRVGALTVDDAVRLEALERMELAERRGWLLPVDTLLTSLPRVALDEELARRFCQGQRLAIDAQPKGGRVRVYAADDTLLGTATINEHGVVGPDRLIANETSIR